MELSTGSAAAPGVPGLGRHRASEPQMVFEAISAAVGMTMARSAVETALTRWEKDAAPGFIASLVQIVQQTEPPRSQRACWLRLWRMRSGQLARQWAQRNGPVSRGREGLHTKRGRRHAAIRPVGPDCAAADAAHRKLAQFDFPSGWPHLISALVGAGAWEQPEQPPPPKFAQCAPSTCRRGAGHEATVDQHCRAGISWCATASTGLRARRS